MNKIKLLTFGIVMASMLFVVHSVTFGQTVTPTPTTMPTVTTTVTTTPSTTVTPTPTRVVPSQAPATGYSGL